MTEARAEKFAKAAAADLVGRMFEVGNATNVLAVIQAQIQDSIKASILKVEWAETMAKMAKNLMCDAGVSKAALAEIGE